MKIIWIKCALSKVNFDKSVYFIYFITLLFYMKSLKEFLNLNKVGKTAALSTVVLVLILANASWVLWAFVRTFNGTDANWVPNPGSYEYGYGYGDNWWGYGYWFGYGYIPTGTSNPDKPTDKPTDKPGTDKPGTWTWVTTPGKPGTWTWVTTPGKPGTWVINPDWTIEFCWVVHNSVKFTDISNNFAKEYIIFLANRGIVHGYVENGSFDLTFRPERNTSRAEYLKMVLWSRCIDDGKDLWATPFSDVSAWTWEARVVNKWVKLWIITTENSKFRPTDPISRAEALKMLLLASKVEVSDATTSSYSDVTGWPVKYVETAKNLEVIAANPKFRPQDSIKRDESAKIIVRVMTLND